MSLLSENLTRCRKALGLEVRDVHAQLTALGVDVAESTVYGWFNGNRGVGKMQHLKALCVVLQTSLDAITGDEIEVVEGPINVSIARESRDLEAAQQEALLAIIRTMRKPSAP